MCRGLRVSKLNLHLIYSLVAGGCLQIELCDVSEYLGMNTNRSSYQDQQHLVNSSDKTVTEPIFWLCRHGA